MILDSNIHPHTPKSRRDLFLGNKTRPISGLHIRAPLGLKSNPGHLSQLLAPTTLLSKPANLALLSGRQTQSRLTPAAVQAPSSLQFGTSTSPATQGVHAHRFITKQGNTVSAMVVPSAGGGAQVTIVVQGSKLGEKAPTPNIHWGMYRAVRSQWHHPKDAVPPGSSLDQATKGMRTPLKWRSDIKAWETSLAVPFKLLPLSLAMVLYFPEADAYDTPRHGSFMSVPLGMDAGQPSPAGASIVAVANARSPQEASCTVNFSVFSRHAASVSLCIVRVKSGADASAPLQGSGVLEIALDPLTNKTGDMWHVCVTGLRDIGMMCYGWRADGDTTWESGGRYHPGFILCDPYAVRAVPVILPESAYANAARMPPKLDLTRPVVLASLSAFVQDFDWKGAHVPLVPGLNQERGARSLEEAVWAELDINTFTTGPEAAHVVPVERQGKYLGILDRLQELAAAGVTGIVLGPCCLSAPGMGPWGRSPLALMAPDTQFAVGGPLAAASELKTVIQALHRVGIEVLMSIEFCITAEGSDAGRRGGLQGMRGLDAAVYYRTMPGGTEVLAAGHPCVRPLILDALRHWALEYQLDGFCLANAENLAQDRFGLVLDGPPLAEDICHDSVLGGLKLVAAPGDNSLLPRNGVRGFPHWGIWMQLNDQFRNDARAYLIQNQAGLLSALATRIAGSADLFAPRIDAPPTLPGCLAAGRRAAFGVNIMAGLGDRMLLEGMLSEGDPMTVEKVARSLLLLQFCSAGTPLISTSTLSDKALGPFVSMLSRVRQQYSSLLTPSLNFRDPAPGEPPVLSRSLTWYAADYGAPVDWACIAAGAAPTNVLALMLSEGTLPPAPGSLPIPPRALYLAFNPYEHPVLLTLPPAVNGMWSVICDAAMPLAGQQPSPDTHYELAPKSALLLASNTTTMPRAI